MKITKWLLLLSLLQSVKVRGDICDDFFGYHTLIEDSVTTTVNSFSYSSYGREETEVWLKDCVLDITIHWPTDSIKWMKDLFEPVVPLPYEGYVAYRLLKEDYGDSIRVVFTYSEVELGETFQYAISRDAILWHLVYGIPVLKLIKDEALLQLAANLAEIRGWKAAIPQIFSQPKSASIYSYYDLLGRRLSTPPAKGVYIKDGKKIVVRSAIK